MGRLDALHASLAAELRSSPAEAARRLLVAREAAEDRLSALEASVDVASALATLDLSALVDGQLVRSSSPRAWWTFVRSALASVDPVEGEVVANGDARFVRAAIADPVHRRTSAWYVSSSGSWTASGTSQGDPTNALELQRRLLNRVYGPTETYVLDDLSDDIYFHVDAALSPHAWFDLNGRLGATTLASGTVTSYAAPSPGSRGELQASFSLAAHVGKMCRVTGGDVEGAQFPIGKSTSGGKAEIGVPMLTPYFGDACALAPGDPFVVEELPALAGTVGLYGMADVGLDNLTLGPVAAHGVNLNVRALFVNACVVRGMDIDGGCVGGQVLGCYVHNALRVYSSAIEVFLGVIGPGATLRAGEHGEIVFADTISYSPLFVHANGDAAIAGWAGFFDVPHVARVMPGGTLLLVNEDDVPGILWGENVAGTIGRLRVHAGGRAKYKAGSEPVLNGAGTEYRIGPDAKAVGDLPYVAANLAAVVHD